MKKRMLFIKPLEVSIRTRCVALGYTRDQFDQALMLWHSGAAPNNDAHAGIFQQFHDRQDTIRKG